MTLSQARKVSERILFDAEKRRAKCREKEAIQQLREEAEENVRALNAGRELPALDSFMVFGLKCFVLGVLVASVCFAVYLHCTE